VVVIAAKNALAALTLTVELPLEYGLNHEAAYPP